MIFCFSETDHRRYMEIQMAGTLIGIVQIASGPGVSPELVWIVVGFLNFDSGLPIYLSFKKGIFHGVK